MSTLAAALGLVALDKNGIVAVGLLVVAGLIAGVLLLWQIIGSRNARADKKKADMAKIEAYRPVMEALASMGKPRGPAAIRTGRHTTMDGVLIEGYDQAIDAEHSETLDMKDVRTIAPSREAPQSSQESD